jgi:hypothetical protein
MLVRRGATFGVRWLGRPASPTKRFTLALRPPPRLAGVRWASRVAAGACYVSLCVVKAAEHEEPRITFAPSVSAAEPSKSLLVSLANLLSSLKAALKTFLRTVQVKKMGSFL